MRSKSSKARMNCSRQPWAGRTRPRLIRKKKQSKTPSWKYSKWSSRKLSVRLKRPNRGRRWCNRSWRRSKVKSRSCLRRRSCRLRLWSSRRRTWSCPTSRRWTRTMKVRRTGVRRRLRRCDSRKRSSSRGMSRMMGRRCPREAAQGGRQWPLATKRKKTRR